MTKEELSNISLPRHIGIIMDGNGRWAKQRGYKRSEGHKEGAKVFRRICDYAAEIGWHVEAFTYSPIKGPKGNIEFLADIRPGEGDMPTDEEIVRLVTLAHETLD